MTIQTVVIPVEGEPYQANVKGSDQLRDFLNKTVGGWFEAIDLEDGNSMFLNEEGKLMGLPRNETATSYARSVTFASDYIVGDVVIAGPPVGESGRTGSASIHAFEQWREARLTQIVDIK